MVGDEETEAVARALPGEQKPQIVVERPSAAAILDLAPDAWLGIDRDLCVTYRNAAAARLLAGRQPQLGVDIRALLPDLADAVFVARCRRVLAAGQPATFLAPAPPADRQRAITVHPLPGGLGIQVGDAVADDEQHRLVRLVALGAALDAAPDAPGVAAALLPCLVPSLADRAAVGRVDEQGTLVPWLPWGERPAAFRDDSAAGLRLTAEDLATLASGGWLAVSLAGGHGGGVVLPLLRGGRLLGTLLLVRRSGAFASEEIAFAGEIARRAALALDALRLRQEAREALASRDHFLAVAAHELRTPLTALRAHAQLVARRRSSGRLDARWLGSAVAAFERATGRLETIVADLLDVARLRLDHLPVRRQSCDLVPLVREIAEREREQWPGRQRLTLQLPKGNCRALVDPGHLEQILVELLSNAAKFSPARGTIAVRLDAGDPGVCLAVRDEGIGLPPGSAEAIFEPFARAENAGVRQIRGLGLGLHRCRELVARNGGQIRAESAGEGTGTELQCWFQHDDA